MVFHGRATGCGRAVAHAWAMGNQKLRVILTIHVSGRTEEQWVRICSQRPMTQILMKVGVWGPKDIWESHA